MFYRISLFAVKTQHESAIGIHMSPPSSSAGKESACNAGDLGSFPGLGKSPREGKGYPLQYSGLTNSMDCIVYGVTELDTTEQLTLSLSLENYIFKLHFILQKFTADNQKIIIQRSH